MNEQNSQERRRGTDAALARADAFGRVLFAGMVPEHQLELLHPNYRDSISRELLPLAAAFVDALVEAGVAQPDTLALYLTSSHGETTRSYSQAIWNALAVVNVSITSQPDWEEVYATIDADFESSEGAGEDIEDEEDEVGDDDDDESIAKVKRWANGIREKLVTIEQLVESAESRPGNNRDHVAAIRAMREDLTTLFDGEMPGHTWNLSFTITQGMDDGSSHGSRTYELSLDEYGVGASCFGTEYERDVGSDSWTGATFRYSLSGRREESGEFYDFAGEFEGALGDSDFVLSMAFYGEPVGGLPEDHPKDSGAERFASRLIRELIGELQSIPDTLSGDDSVLEDVWDEICVQRQIEESVCWDVYELTVNTLIEGLVEQMSHDELVSLWLLTDAGEDWEIDREAEDEQPTPDASDVSNYLYDRLMSVASDYSNHRIILFRDRPRD